MCVIELSMTQNHESQTLNHFHLWFYQLLMSMHFYKWKSLRPYLKLLRAVHCYKGANNVIQRDLVIQYSNNLEQVTVLWGCVMRLMHRRGLTVSMLNVVPTPSLLPFLSLYMCCFPVFSLTFVTWKVSDYPSWSSQCHTGVSVADNLQQTYCVCFML